VLTAGCVDGVGVTVLRWTVPRWTVLGWTVLGVPVLGAAGALVEGAAEAGLVRTPGAWVGPADRPGVIRVLGPAGPGVAGLGVAGLDVAGLDVGEAPGVSCPLGVGRAEVGE
jgi:hypothetical protein